MIYMIFHNDGLGLLTRWIGAGLVQLQHDAPISKSSSGISSNVLSSNVLSLLVRILVTLICNDENGMLNYEHAMRNIPSSVLKQQLSKTS